jgi:SAM-dependent methyltransferase
MQGEPIHTPVDPSSVKTVVEVACGTGAMTILLAERFPNAHIYGVDISLVPDAAKQQAAAAGVSERVTWIQGNIFSLVESNPALKAGSVDFVFHRMIRAARLSYYDYLYNVVNALLRPGGWVEMQDNQDPLWYTFKNNAPISGETWPWLSDIGRAFDPPRYDSKPYLRFAEMPTALQLLDFTDVSFKWYKNTLKAIEGHPETKIWAHYAVQTYPDMFALGLSYAFPEKENQDKLNGWIKNLHETVGIERDDVYW